MQVGGLVFERTPVAFDKDIVNKPAPGIHGDADASIFERAGEGKAGELAALVGVENLRRGVTLQSLLQSINAEPGIHAIRQPPRQNVARRLVHRRDEIEEAGGTGI